MFDKHIDFLERQMDVSTLKRTIIADNISNYNTPDYKAKKVAFEHLFEENRNLEMEKTNKKHLSHQTKGEPIISTDATAKERYDGNSVDLTNEMIEMIKNNHLYNISVQATNKQFALYKIALTSGA